MNGLDFVSFRPAPGLEMKIEFRRRAGDRDFIAGMALTQSSLDEQRRSFIEAEVAQFYVHAAAT
jgi:hypothetical protein